MYAFILFPALATASPVALSTVSPKFAQSSTNDPAFDLTVSSGTNDKIAPAASVSATAISGVTAQNSLQLLQVKISEVPEPRTWSTLAAGLLMVGAGMLRRVGKRSKRTVPGDTRAEV